MSTPSQLRLVILADDLTGAADSAARAVQAGLGAAVMLEPANWRDAAADMAVIALTTDSRHLPAEEAAARVRTVAAPLVGLEEVTVYKKIDSTLRGNLGAELAALLASLEPSTHPKQVVVCPAFPAQGRGLADGYLVHGGASPATPNLLRKLGEQMDAAVEAVGLATVRGGVSPLVHALQRAFVQARLVVVDAMTDEDINVVVDAAQQVGVLLCGSAGMVGPLATRLAAGREVEDNVPPVRAGPVLTVVGSGSVMAHRQIAVVRRRTNCRVRELNKTWHTLDLVGVASHPTGDWLLHLAPPQSHTVAEGSGARVHAARLADMARLAVQRLQPGVIIVVGGDTAHYLLRCLGIQQLTVHREVLPGIAYSTGIDRYGVERGFVLKPGSFGDANTLVTLLNHIHRATAQAA